MYDQAFLRAIRAAPDEDAPRLVFADWLDEHGHPERAEFVRVQVELEPIRDELERPRVAQLRAREAELLAAHRAAWLGGAADIEAAPPAFGPVFRRGFPELVCLRLDTFLARGEGLFAEHPTLREVAVFDSAGRAAELAASPALAHVETLELAEASFTEAPESSDALSAALDRAGVTRLRIPAVCDPPFAHPHLFHSLARRRYPEQLDAVVLLPLSQTLPPAALGNLGPVKGRLVRPTERLFPIDGGNPEDVWAGWVQGKPVLDRQILAGHSGGRPVLVGVKLLHGSPQDAMDNAVINAAIFGDDGKMTGEATYPIRAWKFGTRKSFDLTLGTQIVTTLRDELGFEPGLIRVREFRTREGMMAHLWPRKLFDDYLYLANPAEQAEECRDDVATWRARGGALRRWLHERAFVVWWDRKEFVFDDAGRLNPMTR